MEPLYRIALLLVAGSVAFFGAWLVARNLRRRPRRTGQMLLGAACFLVGTTLSLNALARGRYESYGPEPLSAGRPIPTEGIALNTPSAPPPDKLFPREPGLVPLPTPDG